MIKLERVDEILKQPLKVLNKQHKSETRFLNMKKNELLLGNLAQGQI